MILSDPRIRDKSELYRDKECTITLDASSYRGKYNGKVGKITRPGADSVGVMFPGQHNAASSYGCYWFKKNELDVLIEQEEEIVIAQRSGKTLAFSSAIEKLGAAMAAAMVHPSARYTLVEPMKPDMVCYDEFSCLSKEEFDAMYNGVWDAKKVEEFDMLKIMEMAKEKEIKLEGDRKATEVTALLDADDVVYALNAKRAAEERKPLSYVQKVEMMCPETAEKIKQAEEEGKKNLMDIERKYEELYATLELPEANVIEILKAAGILRDDCTGLA